MSRSVREVVVGVTLEPGPLAQSGGEIEHV